MTDDNNALTPERECCFKLRRNIDPFEGELREDCQFKSETEFFDVDGKLYCRFHMPLEDKDGNQTTKGDNSWWNSNAHQIFRDGILFELGWGSEEERNVYQADLCGVVFPQGFGLSELVKYRAEMLFSTNHDQKIKFPSLLAEGASFSNVIFLHPKEVHFSAGTSFKNAKFGFFAWFKGVTFGSYTSFAGAQFVGIADFSAGENNAVLDDVDFSGAKFGTNEAKYETDIPPSASFENRKFTGKADFRDAVFYVAPDFHGAELHQSCTIDEAEFLDVKGRGAPSAYRTLKLAMEEKRNWNGMAKFHALEERSLRHQPGTPWFVRFVSWSYDMASEYGQSLARPLVGIFAVAFVWFLFYCLVLGLAGIKGDASLLAEVFKFDLMQMVRPFEAFVHSVPDDPVLGPLGSFGRFAVITLAFLQTLATAGFVTLFILAVRRRFRMA